MDEFSCEERERKKEKKVALTRVDLWRLYIMLGGWIIRCAVRTRNTRSTDTAQWFPGGFQREEERERERSSRFRLVNNSVCIKVVARATTTNDYAILFETRLNFPKSKKSSRSRHVAGKKRERRVKGGEAREMEAQTFKRFQERDFFNQNLGILGASLCFSKGVRRLSPCLLCLLLFFIFPF